MKKTVLLVIAASLFIAGCAGTQVVPTRTSPTKFIVESDCK